MKYRCGDCTYHGKRVVLVNNKHVICPACGGDIKISYKMVAEEIEREEEVVRQEVETLSCSDIEKKKSSLETDEDSKYIWGGM